MITLYLQSTDEENTVQCDAKHPDAFSIVLKLCIISQQVNAFHILVGVFQPTLSWTIMDILSIFIRPPSIYVVAFFKPL